MRETSVGRLFSSLAAGLLLTALLAAVGPVQAQQQKPNIVVIMGDDVGWSNIGAYNQGIMAGRTPNLDRLAAEGMRFTDYYAEASCTAGRANFITGELPFRTGLTTVGQAGAPLGIPDEAVTIAQVLKSMGYIPRLSENPKIPGVDDAEVVGDLVAETMPVSRHLLTQEVKDRRPELGEARVAFVVSDMPMHQRP